VGIIGRTCRCRSKHGREKKTQQSLVLPHGASPMVFLLGTSLTETHDAAMASAGPLASKHDGSFVTQCVVIAGASSWNDDVRYPLAKIFFSTKHAPPALRMRLQR